MKKNLLFTIIGLIAGTTLTAGAAYVYTARDINYQSSDENWNVSNVQEAISELKTDVNTISNKVDGIERIYKAGEVELVALVSDNSFYKDSNGKYVLSDSETGRTLLADTSTYKSLASTSDCVGIIGDEKVFTVDSNSALVMIGVKHNVSWYQFMYEPNVINRWVTSATANLKGNIVEIKYLTNPERVAIIALKDVNVVGIVEDYTTNQDRNYSVSTYSSGEEITQIYGSENKQYFYFVSQK